ncbi:nuclear transport factor 2 family protein [Phreatobacter sp.]|uniref:nuclear transport factor 2 family protein n=1 Tax=Phreatobacter sp. TaxID=1966341 RepID=UPI003F71745D
MSLRLVTDELSHEQKLKVAYSAWSRGDVSALHSIFSEDCEFNLIGNPVLNANAGLRVGPAGVLEVLQQFHRMFVVREFLIEKIIVNGDDAVVHWHSSLEFRPNGRIIDSERCDLIRFRGGRIRSIKCFYDSATMAIVTGQARPASDVADEVAQARKA